MVKKHTRKPPFHPPNLSSSTKPKQLCQNSSSVVVVGSKKDQIQLSSPSSPKSPYVAAAGSKQDQVQSSPSSPKSQVRDSISSIPTSKATKSQTPPFFIS
ncbi:unnamed protein product [Cochlearia groenlandica]